MEKHIKINSLSPTESLMILHPSYPSKGEFIKYSIVELINLKVLNVYRDFAGLKDLPTLKYWFIQKGECYNLVKTRTYHNIFIEKFKDRNKKIPIQVYGKQIFSSTNWNKFKDELVYPLLIEKGIYTNTFLSHVNIYILSEKGSKFKRSLRNEIKKLEKAIDRENIINVLESCEILGLNIFLSYKINSKVLKMVSSAINSMPGVHSYSDSLLYTNFDFREFSSLDTSFDSLDFGGGDFGGGGADGDFDSGSSWD